MKEFLPQLKRITRPTNNGNSYVKKDLKFCIHTPSDSEPTLCAINGKGNPIKPDYRFYTGGIAQLLRAMERARCDDESQISWDENDLQQISLKRHPELIYLLMMCDNLVDNDMKPIGTSLTPANIELQLVKDGRQIIPSLQAECEHKRYTDFRLLSDSFLLADNILYPLAPLGENYDQLPFLITPFQDDMLESYLSIFFSYVDNIQLAASDDYEVDTTTENPEHTITAILFEKVDNDHSLYLKVTESVPGLPLDILQQFDLNRIAQLKPDHTIAIKQLIHQPIDTDVAHVHKLLMQYAPNKQAQKDIFQKDNFFIIPPETAAIFLRQGLPLLLSRYRLIGAEKLHEYKIRIERPHLSLNLSSGIDFLEGNANIQVGKETFSLQQFLSQYRKQRYIELSDGSHVLVEDRYMRRLERLFKPKKEKVSISFFDLPEVEELLDTPIKGEAFRQHRTLYEGFNKLKGQKLKLPALKAQLRPYQQEGVKWIKYLYDNRLGGCLADDMGLGKTLQAITMLALSAPVAKAPALIVMPRSLLFNWQNELEKFAPQLSVYTYYGSTRDMDKARESHVILTTYAIVRNDISAFTQETFDYVILDESQNVKNLSAQATQAVLLLKAQHRLALSGTPIENNLTELYALFRFLNPTMFGSQNDFNTRYTYPIQTDNDQDALLSLRKKIYPFMLRRLKKDVLKELPDRMEQTLYVEMNNEQANFYEQRRAYYYQQVKNHIKTEGLQKSQLMMFQALNELRRIASVPESLSNGEITSPKLDTLLNTVEEAVANRHKVVIFFNFIAGVELTGERLDQLNIDYACMTGSTTDRRSVVERFQNDPHCMVLLMTLKTGGVGLNLTAADTVLIFEPWWNKAAEEQAVNRLHRFGQTAKVISYSLITKDSIEEKILQLQQQKADLFKGLIESDSTLSKHLTEEDINYILG